MIKRRDSKTVAFLTLVALLMSIPLSSAFIDFSNAGYQIERTINDLVMASRPVFQALFGDYGSSEFLFVKVLLFLMLIIIIKSILIRIDFFQGNLKLVNIISLIVPILSIRFMKDNELIRGILLPYGAMGVAITTILPLLLFFYFVHFTKMGGFGRRMSWILFMIVSAVFWNSRYSDLSPEVNKIFWWASVAAILLFIFDKEIHNYFKKWELSAFYRGANQKTIAALQSEYLNIISLETPAANARRRAIETQLTRLGASLP